MCILLHGYNQSQKIGKSCFLIIGISEPIFKPLLRCLKFSMSSPQVDPVRVLATCLAKCGEVLEQSASVFAGVQESSLLREICEVEEGRNKLRGRLVRV